MTILSKPSPRLDQHALANPPHGFCISQTPDGDLLVEYRNEQRVSWAYLILLVISGSLIYIICILGEWAAFCALPALLILFVACFCNLLHWRERVFAKQIELQAEQLLFHECSRSGMQCVLQIPTAAIKAVRIIFTAGNSDSSPYWHIQLTLVSDQLSLAVDMNAAATRWLGSVLAAWAGLGLIWESSDGFAALYQPITAATLAPSTRPALTAIDPIPESPSRVVGVAFLLLCVLVSWLTLNSWVYRERYPLLAAQGFNGVVLCVSLLLCFWLLAALANPDPLRRRFRYEQVEAQGWITQRWMTYANAPVDDQYYIAYAFPGGEETKQAVAPIVYAALQVGDPLRVCYLSADPKISKGKLEQTSFLTNALALDHRSTERHK